MKYTLFFLAMVACDIPLQGVAVHGTTDTAHDSRTDTSGAYDAGGDVSVDAATDTPRVDALHFDAVDAANNDPCFYCEASNLGPDITLVVVPCRDTLVDGVCYLDTPNFDCSIECLDGATADYVCDRIARITCDPK